MYSGAYWENYKKKSNWSNRTQKSTIFWTFQNTLPTTIFFRSCDFIWTFLIFSCARQSWNIKIIILLLHKNYLLFCGMFEKYPRFLSDNWLITKRRVVAVARRVVAVARRVVVVARRVVVARPLTSCCRRLSPWKDWLTKKGFYDPQNKSLA